MATIYAFNYSDTNKNGFTIQPYTSNGTISPSSTQVLSQATAANTTLKLYGKGMLEFGEGVEQNLVYMLENFANSTRPVFSSEGQLWYNNAAGGSPVMSPELFIRNSDSDDTTGGIGWDAVILATGSSPMKGELLLSADPITNLGATPKQYVDGILLGHTGDATVHITPDQSTFLDTLTLPTLTGLEVDQLIGINTGISVQTQIDNKINLAGDTMDVSANLSFNGGEVLGLPNTPSVDDAAASKFYVDGQLSAGGFGDGVLTDVNWLTVPVGSVNEPDPAALQFIISQQGVQVATITAAGISRPGHLHPASEISYDNSTNVSYPSDIQLVIDQIVDNKADLAGPAFTGNVSIGGNLTAQGAAFDGNITAADPTLASHLATKLYVDLVSDNISSTVTRTFESIAADIISPAVYLTQNHTADDNKLSITINGMKQYNASNGVNNILYNKSINNLSPTGLDDGTVYDFDIAVDGGSPITIIIPANTNSISTHNDLISIINTLLTSASPTLDAKMVLVDDSTTEQFVSLISGASSSITISDPVSVNQYLFAIDTTPTNIISATFLSEPSTTINNPDDIILPGDLTSTFTVGTVFKIDGSFDVTYGSFDGTYRVHANGAVFNTTNTVIPIGSLEDLNLNISLLPTYVPGGSPPAALPSPTPFGNILLQPIEGLIQVLLPVNGLDGDYVETDNAGTAVPLGEPTDSVVFNDTIPTGSKIETILLG